jgi:hypothetical protein
MFLPTRASSVLPFFSSSGSFALKYPMRAAHSDAAGKTHTKLEPAAVNALLAHKIRLFCNDVVSASSVIYDLNLIPYFGSLLLFDSFTHRGLFDLVFYRLKFNLIQT